jgi:hypothetical protein
MNSKLTNMQRARETAAQYAAAELAGIDLATRCALLGLPMPDADGTLTLRLFGKTVTGFVPSDPANPPGMSAVERVLVLHYLMCDFPVIPAEKLLSFRDLPGGQFYWDPFCSRTADPLVHRFHNDVAALRGNLERFDHTLLSDLCSSPADLTARIHAFGRIELTLIYRAGGEETGPAANVLFDECVKRIFNTEDAVAIASRICLGLL